MANMADDSSAAGKPDTVADAIDAIEEAYDFMLAYAAQGRERETDDPMGVRLYLTRAVDGIDYLSAADANEFGAAAEAVAGATGALLAVLRDDGASARAAISFVLAQRAIGSQIIDNLNASIHVRALLTDIFLIDEALNENNGE
ncbi:MAG: hypothetical protein KDJ29_09035 [Hyphomicrobiales bacterium]|nr:hypothetical protein [Hyphomicrobiales bacterium]